MKPNDSLDGYCVSGHLLVRMSVRMLPEGQRHGFREAQGPAVEEAVSTATDAYVYGYSLITTEVTRVQMSNFPKAEGMHAPMGQFANAPRYPPRGLPAAYPAPNADTLYSLAWLDLAGPQELFSHPDMGKRFYLFEMTDLWMTDFNTPGTRTQGGAARQVLDNRAGMERLGACRDEEDQGSDSLYCHPGPHICQRDRSGLQRLSMRYRRSTPSFR